MKCVILGFDALEYKFVQDFRLDNLKQEEFGKVSIPQECFVTVNTEYSKKDLVEPQTPLVWFSFLTGKLPSEVGFHPIRWRSSIINKLSDLLKDKIQLKTVEVQRVKQALTDFLHLEKRRSGIRDYEVSTIFDLSRKSHAVNVPLFSTNWWGWGYGMDPGDFKSFEEFINTVLHRQLIEFERQKYKTLSFFENDKNWELFMTYFYILDAYGELCFAKKHDLSRIYSAVDKFVGEVKKEIGESFLIIVSDHGIERLPGTCFGKHSDYGFYSINQKLELRDPDITSFYALVKEILLIDS